VFVFGIFPRCDAFRKFAQKHREIGKINKTLQKRLENLQAAQEQAALARLGTCLVL